MPPCNQAYKYKMSTRPTNTAVLVGSRSSKRPVPKVPLVRQAKKNAIENIKKCIAEMNTYDDNGVLYDVKEETQPVKSIVTREDVVTLYNKSEYIPEILALYPPHLRDQLIEDDVRIDWIEKILAGRIRDVSSFKSNKRWKEYSMIVDYYANHTQEAKDAILVYIEEMWADYC